MTEQAQRQLNNTYDLQCALCQREGVELTDHHLTPRQKTKRKGDEPGPTIPICWACHRQLRSLFDNTYLARELNSLEKLLQEPKLQAFLRWVRKQDPAKRVRVRSKRR